MNFWSSPIQIRLDWTGLWIQRIDPVHSILWCQWLHQRPLTPDKLGNVKMQCKPKILLRNAYPCAYAYHKQIPSVSQKNVIVYFAHTAKIKSRIFKCNGSKGSSNGGNLSHAYHHHCTCNTLALQDVLKMATFSEVADIYPFHHTIDGAGTYGIRDRPHGTPDRCLQFSPTLGFFLTDDGLQEAPQIEVQRG